MLQQKKLLIGSAVTFLAGVVEMSFGVAISAEDQSMIAGGLAALVGVIGLIVDYVRKHREPQ